MNMPHVVKNGVHKTNGRSPSSMAATVATTVKMKVSPDLAKKWLGQNTDSNRRVSERTVEAYAREMEAGRWTLTHQGIAFNKTGELVDGQHRLHAIIKADVTVEMMVTTGLPLEYNSPIDQGYNRSAAHLLGKNTRWVSVARALVVLETGLPSKGFKNTVGLLETTAKRHEAAMDAIMAICSSWKSVPSGVVAALVYAYPVDMNTVAAFAKDVNNGEMLQAGDPALRLRKWIFQGRHSSRETILAGIAGVRAALEGRKLSRIVAGIHGDTYEGTSNYVWLVARRRAKKIWEGTPSVDIVSSRDTKKALAEIEVES